MEDRESGKDCICKKCEKCNFYRHWRMVNDRGEEKIVMRCSLIVVCDEIPKVRGSIDGCQGAVNEARNRSIEAKMDIQHFIGMLSHMAKTKLLGRGQA